MNFTTLFTVVLSILLGVVSACADEISLSAKQPASKSVFLLQPARVFDGEDSQPHEGWSVLVVSNKIVAVGPISEITAPSEAVKVDLAGMTLLPGLMDIHSHIFLNIE